jgi:hypothetical protein
VETAEACVKAIKKEKKKRKENGKKSDLATGDSMLVSLSASMCDAEFRETKSVH